MESCVVQVMNDSKMKSKYPDHDERKSHAIAICHSSIMGTQNKKADLPSQITFNINLNDYWQQKVEAADCDETISIDSQLTEKKDDEQIEEDIEKTVWTTAYVNDLPDSAFAYISSGGKKDAEGKTVPRSLRHLPYKDKDGKPDAAHVRNALARLPQTDISAEAKASAHAKLVAAAKELGIEVSDQSKIDGEGGDDNMTKEEKDKLAAMDAEMKACVTGHMKEGKSMQEAMGMCEKAGKKVEGEGDVAKQDEADAAAEATEEAGADKEEATAEEAKTEEDAKEEVAEADSATDLLKQVLGKMEEIQASLKKEDDSASAEGAASGEQPAAPEGGEKDSPVEDQASDEGASPEGAEEVAKVSSSLAKISDQLVKLEESFTTKFEDLAGRVGKLEEQPAPSKVGSPKVVSKTDGEEAPKANSARLAEIKEELAKMEELKRVDLERFQKERTWEKAFKLIEERDSLMAIEG